MNTPIVMVAFGTTSKAIETYRFIDEAVKQRFPDNDIFWAYSSRMVKARVKSRRKIKMKHPHQVLAELDRKGHEWAVVQSLHLVCGHEFYRLVDEVRNGPIRVAMGLPLLTDHQDYACVVDVLRSVLIVAEDEAMVMVGHGTDHPIWTAYTALHQLCREKYGSGIFFGVVEGHPGRETIVEKVAAEGYKKVRLAPFMLVAGVHFKEDLAGEKYSWKAAFEDKGILVSLEPRGLGHCCGIIDIFIRHIREGLDAIPNRNRMLRAEVLHCHSNRRRPRMIGYRCKDRTC